MKSDHWTAGEDGLTRRENFKMHPASVSVYYRAQFKFMERRRASQTWAGRLILLLHTRKVVGI